ncbi:hypothetical protein [Bradyrhizobium sp. NP1]|uniref:hypothetical protein n=1 Tax=Bradyrhizobium sp. NP1 TaxID=3049772 RepID=UPI0025A6585B|nr:hypothetical protein [Bradyrhizobium sp. NP1]WJR78014.1 hypothetical protein QOU61_35845 [Bradyrhizobium sp. NP1]
MIDPSGLTQLFARGAPISASKLLWQAGQKEKIQHDLRVARDSHSRAQMRVTMG